MRIMIFHPALLPPRDYGGVERVVLWLAKGLKELGHEVSVAALAGSYLPDGVKLAPVEPGRVSALDFARANGGGADVVHFMAPPEPGAASALGCPWLLTVHGNGKPGETFPPNAVFLSADHAARHGSKIFVHNGIDPAEYVFSKDKSDEFLFLSKTSWSVKNLRGAVAMCRRAGVKLAIAGGHRPLMLRIEALLNPRLRWLGPVAGAAKAVALARARALVFPVKWNEPFGLVVAEALMSGTPVIASRRGSLPGLLSDDVGLLLDPDDEEAWVGALREGLRHDPVRCREYAMEKFHYKRMAREYAALYEKIQGGCRL